MSKLPAIQFYPGDWKKDAGVQALSFHDRGVWFEILLMMHESEKRGLLLLAGAPMPEDALARSLGLDKQILTSTLTTLLTYGVASVDAATGAIMSRRMVRDEELRQTRKTAGKLGGNPVLVKQNPTTRVKQNPTPSSSSSSSSSDLKERGDLPLEEIHTGALPEVPDPQPESKYFDLSRQDVSSGRFCLKRHPHMWMHFHELTDARDQFTRAGLTLLDFRDCAKICDVSMESKKHMANFKGGLAYKYLTTHILTDALAKKKAVNQAGGGYSPSAAAAHPSRHPPPRAPVICPQGPVKNLIDNLAKK